MNENFLHLLWQTQRFDKNYLTTTKGEKLTILKVGKHNQFNGPDFLEASIEIEDVKWFGSVEIHIKSSDWNKHAHNADPNYKNVVLHVVYENDMEICATNNNTPLPCLELKNKISIESLVRYKTITESENSIPCAVHFKDVRDIIKKNWLDRVFTMRLEAQSDRMIVAAKKNTNKYDEILWQLVFRYIVSPPNHNAIVTLFESIPFQHLKRLKDNPKAIEAILIGQAGFLVDNLKDLYVVELQKEYAYQKQKLQLEPLPKNIWITKSIRNAATVCTRLSQLAYLLSKNENIFSQILVVTNTKQLETIFEAKANNYWHNHNTPDFETVFEEKKLGKTTIDVITTNAILPFLFFYSNILGDDSLKTMSLELFQSVRPEKNSITNIWKNLGFSAENAAESQALIHLKKNFCDTKRCFNCAIGANILISSDQ